MEGLVRSFRKLSSSPLRQRNLSNIADSEGTTYSMPSVDIIDSSSVTHGSFLHPDNEDRFDVIDDFTSQDIPELNANTPINLHNCDTTTQALYAVYDGHGGAHVSEYVSSVLSARLALALRSRQLRTEATPDFIAHTLTSTFISVDKDCCRKFSQGGSCALVSFLYGNNLFVANIGDCQGFLFGFKKSKRDNYAGTWLFRNPLRPKVIEVLNNRHSVNDKSEFKRVIDQGGVIVNGRVGGSLIPTRSFGDAPLKKHGVTGKPEVFMFPLQSGLRYYIVLATDGLWDYTTLERVTNTVTLGHHRSLDNEAIVENLLNLALMRGTHDDVSIVVGTLDVGSRDEFLGETSCSSAPSQPCRLVEDVSGTINGKLIFGSQKHKAISVDNLLTSPNHFFLKKPSCTIQKQIVTKHDVINEHELEHEKINATTSTSQPMVVSVK